MSDLPVSQDSSEDRRSARMPARRVGWIARTKGEQLRECVVWDESETGARLDVDNPQQFPDSFYLYMTLEFTSRRHCQVVWRSERQLGVKYIETAKPGAAQVSSISA